MPQPAPPGAAAPAARQRHRYAGVVADTVDFRDQMYLPRLIDVPMRMPVEAYLACAVPVHDQGNEPACTGFGLATVANYLLRRRAVDRDDTPVSPRMAYEIAKRYDEWAGEHHTGSSARGAMKGWHKHGVCAEALWPFVVGDDTCVLTGARALDALTRPLGAYYRVKTKDLAAMHAALAEVGILYVTAGVHEGWHQAGADGIVPWPRDHIGGHAFVIVGYDEHGFWFQNSKGPGWGRAGCGRLSYEDWLANGQDVWVARLGVPIAIAASPGRAASLSHRAHAFAALRPHVVSLGESGAPSRTGTYATAKGDIAAIIGSELPEATKNWAKRRVLVYAPGGLADEATALQDFASMRDALLAAEIYPLALDWRHSFAPALCDILTKAAGGSAAPQGDTIEPLARRNGGRALWQRLAAHAALATTAEGGAARLVALELAKLAGTPGNVEIHLLGHGTGALLIAWLAPLLTGKADLPAPYAKATGLGLAVASCTLWAPACSAELAGERLLPAIMSGAIDRLTLVTLAEPVEQADTTCGIYHGSLLRLVSRALEATPCIAGHSTGTAIFGLAETATQDATLGGLLKQERHAWVVAGESRDAAGALRSTAQHHGDFAGDAPTLRTTIARILATVGASS